MSIIYFIHYILYVELSILPPYKTMYLYYEYKINVFSCIISVNIKNYRFKINLLLVYKTGVQMNNKT